MLNFDLDDPNQGIFISPVNGNGSSNGDIDSTRVEQVLHSSPRKLAFIVPAGLESGEYIVEVRSLFGVETIRTGVLEETLTVG